MRIHSEADRRSLHLFQRVPRKRQVNYAESASSDSGDEDVFKPKTSRTTSSRDKSKIAQLAAKRRKVSDDSDDDFELGSAADESEADFAIAADDKSESSAARSEDEDEASPPPKKKSKAAASNSSPAVAKSTPARPTMMTSSSSSSMLMMTKAEQKLLDAKEKKTTNEQPFSFLQDVRDRDRNHPGSPNYDPRTLYIPPSAWKTFSPFETQFWKIKQDHYDTVLFFQKGKFYELYEDDALIAHREFDLKLTDRVKMKMAGVPENSFELFAAKFLALGYKVGRVDQMETAVAKGMRTGHSSKGGSSGIVNRELRHVLTSGTIVEPSALPDDLNSYCVAIKETLEDGDTEAKRPTLGICTLDAATAEFRLAHFTDDETRCQLETLLRSLRIKELLYEKGQLSAASLCMIKGCLTQDCRITMLKPKEEFLIASEARDMLKKMFKDGQEPPPAISSMQEQDEPMSALGAMLTYLHQLNLDKDLCSSRNFDIYDPIRKNECLVLDAQSLTHLNVLTNEQGDEAGTLHQLLNRCVTPFGKRLFKVWLVSPLLKVDAINARLDAVEDLLASSDFVEHFERFTRKLPDIERIVPRIFAGTCKPKEFVAVLNALSSFAKNVSKLEDLAESHTHESIRAILKGIPAFADVLEDLKTQFTVTGNESFNPTDGVHEDFDDAEAAVLAVEAQLEEERRAAAKMLKISPDQINFKHSGTKDIYQMEVARKIKVPPNWSLISQTKSHYRHYSPVSMKLVQKLKEARETRGEALRSFHGVLFGRFCEHAPVFLRAVKALAELDCLVSLSKASYAMGQPCCRPTLVESDSAMIDFKELRHPCIAASSSVADFIPNDVALGTEDHEEFVILTGGNMAGKSTTARTAAVAAIIAQLGCYVPAESATLSPIDRIASRMGANDQIFRNNSTFMVEMLEASRVSLSGLTQCCIMLIASAPADFERGHAAIAGHHGRAWAWNLHIRRAGHRARRLAPLDRPHSLHRLLPHPLCLSRIRL